VLLSLIFCQEMSLLLFPTTVFSNALQNWLVLWNKHEQKYSQEDGFFRSIDSGGFTRHSQEFYLLGLAKLEYIKRRQEEDNNVLLDEPNMKSVKDLILSMKTTISGGLQT